MQCNNVTVQEQASKSRSVKRRLWTKERRWGGEDCNWGNSKWLAGGAVVIRRFKPNRLSDEVGIWKLIFDNYCSQMSKRSKLRNLFVFGGALKSTLNLVCRGVVDIHRTLNVLDQVLEVLISPVILSSIFFNVIVQIRGKTAVRSSRSHQQK